MGDVATDLAFPGMTVDESLAELTARAIRLQVAVQLDFDRRAVHRALDGLTVRQLKAIAIECAARANVNVDEDEQLAWMDAAV